MKIIYNNTAIGVNLRFHFLIQSQTLTFSPVRSLPNDRDSRKRGEL